MKLTLDLPADLERRLRRGARREGGGVERYVLRLLEERAVGTDEAHPLVLRRAEEEEPQEREEDRPFHEESFPRGVAGSVQHVGR